MKSIRIIRDTVCRYFMHESTRYPRPGFLEVDRPDYSFKQGEILVVVEMWSNCYGDYFRAHREGEEKTFDISQRDATLLW